MYASKVASQRQKVVEGRIAKLLGALLEKVRRLVGRGLLGRLQCVWGGGGVGGKSLTSTLEAHTSNITFKICEKFQKI